MESNTVIYLLAGVAIMDIATVAMLWNKIPAKSRPLVLAAEGFFILLLIYAMFTLSGTPPAP